MSPALKWLVVLAAFAVTAFAADRFGHERGVNAQKAADQKQFDKINADLTRQKAEANELYRQAQDDIIALQVERDTIKTDLEKRREADRKTTDDTRIKFAGVGLRFRPDQGAGDRAHGCSAQAPGTDAAQPSPAPAVELPATVARDLRQLALDADTLADEYRKCYGYAVTVR